VKNWGRFVISMELRKILAYRSDFWLSFLGQTFIQLFVGRALWQSVFEASNVTEMNGMNIDTLTLYYLIAPIGTRILTGENIGFISREIYEGSFTKYLIYPLSFFSYKSITYLTYSLFYSIQLLILYILYSLFYYHSLPDFTHFGFAIAGTLTFLIASVASMSIAMSIELLALWVDNTWSLMVGFRFFMHFLGGAFIPLVFFPEWANKALEWTPFPYFVNFPIQTFMGNISLHDWIKQASVLLLWVLVCATISKLIWKRGQYQYTGVGI